MSVREPTTEESVRDGASTETCNLLLVVSRVKPLAYLGWLIGHEGGGSILSYLKKR